MDKLRLKDIDIREIFDDLDIYYSETGKNVSKGWIGVQCPFCDDSSNHMGVNLYSLSISCFSCGVSGTVLKLLSQELRSYQKAKKLLEKAIPRQLRKNINFESEVITKCELPEGCKKKIPKQHLKYFKKRGFNLKKLTKKYNLYFTKDDVEDWKWSYRVIIPIKRRNRLVTYTSVSVQKYSHVRYLHCPDEDSIIPIKHLLIGEEFCKKSKIVVVEGHFDFFKIGDGSVTTLGTQVTPEQVYLLKKYNRVLIVFDGDKPGRKGTIKLSQQLSALTKVVIIDLPEDIDPDKLGKKDISYIRDY